MKKEIFTAGADKISVKNDVNASLSSFNLSERSTDKEIEAALPKKHLFDASEVYAIVGGMISKQPKGEDGDLLANGYANLFYTKAFVVSVRWNGSGWGVDAWERDGFSWFAGYRVFSPAN